MDGEGTDRNFRDFYARYKNKLDLVNSKGILRLMQLGFLGSFRWGSDTSVKQFEILDTMDDMRMARLQLSDGDYWSHKFLS